MAAFPCRAALKTTTETGGCPHEAGERRHGEPLDPRGRGRWAPNVENGGAHLREAVVVATAVRWAVIVLLVVHGLTVTVLLWWGLHAASVW
jgi:hypothetical protein